MYGLATNCVDCKALSSQIFLNNKNERLCADCIQIEYDKMAHKNKELFAILEQIKNFTQLVKNE